MDQGKNVSPQWAPDGRSIAFVSDRSGVSNIFLYDLGDGQIYQLTDFYTGVQGITPLSRCCRWAREADRLAFVYYEDQKFDVYTINNPRGLKRAAVRAAGGRQRRHPGPRRHAAARHHPLAPGPRRGAVAGRRGRLDLPDAAGLPLVERPGPDRRHRPARAAGVDQRADGFGQLQPARHQRVHAEGLPGALLARLHRAARPSATRATTSAAASSAGRRSR